MRVARRFLALALAVGSTVVASAVGCSGKGGPGPTNSAGSANSSGSTGPSISCDPLAPPPTALENVLAVGKGHSATLYVVDEVPDSGQDRVFVSSGQTLFGQDVTGSGSVGTGFDQFSFRSASADASDVRTLLLQRSGGAVTGMAVTSGYASKDLRAIPDAGVEALAILDASATTGLSVQGLPGVIQFVGDVSSGDVIIVTAPLDAWGYSGFRLFYGTPKQMVEETITAYNQALSGPAQISFSVGSSTYTLNTTVVYGADAGPLGSPGPAMLETGGAPSGTLAVSLRLPTPTSLSGFSFVCL